MNNTEAHDEALCHCEDLLVQCWQYTERQLEGLDVMGRAIYFCLNHPDSLEFKYHRKILIGLHERLGKDTTHMLAQLDKPEEPYEPTPEELAQHG